MPVYMAHMNLLASTTQPETLYTDNNNNDSDTNDNKHDDITPKMHRIHLSKTHTNTHNYTLL